LYAAGATEVLIDNIFEEHAASEGGPYADSLIIRFGRDSSAGPELLDMCEHAIEGEADGGVDHGCDEMRVWWDYDIPLLEEPLLERRFGKAYREHLRRVRRFVPRARPWCPVAPSGRESR
jgi:hypothetical protein